MWQLAPTHTNLLPFWGAYKIARKWYSVTPFIHAVPIQVHLRQNPNADRHALVSALSAIRKESLDSLGTMDLADTAGLRSDCLPAFGQYPTWSNPDDEHTSFRSKGHHLQFQ